MLHGGGHEGADGGIDGRGDLAHLHRVADAEGGQTAKDAEHRAQPLPVLTQTVLDIIHGAAHPVAQDVALPELHGQQHLGVLGSHAQQGGHPQPEDRTRAAQGNGKGDTGDVAGAHGSRQSGGQGLEGSDFTSLGGLPFEHLAHGVLHGVAELPELEALQPHSQDDACGHQQHQGGDPPHNVVQPAVSFFDRLINLFHTLSPFPFPNPHIEAKRGRRGTPPSAQTENENTSPRVSLPGQYIPIPSFCLRDYGPAACTFGIRPFAEFSRISSARSPALRHLRDLRLRWGALPFSRAPALLRTSSDM